MTNKSANYETSGYLNVNIQTENNKAIEILKEHLYFIHNKSIDHKGIYYIQIVSKDTGASLHIHLTNEKEVEILKGVLEVFDYDK